MKRLAIQQNAIGSSQEEIQSSIPMSVMVMDRGESLVCPKPYRYPVRSLRWQLSPQGEFCDSEPGSDVLDILLSKDGCGLEESRRQVASPPSFFCGSPPSRVANPLIRDAQFGDEKVVVPLSQSPRKGSCVRANFGNKPAVRVEGFDCLDRDSRNRSIPALA